ncbi:MAG TPA: hypothetical protein PLD14_01425 [Candidatus Pacearchaeota archaeon]|nr:hypothetical protein [Candidatus Pacearchaeota archaeon]HPR79860.1 hypothetical protein [Candidatus Pacearchaeota archaeon]
MVSFRDFILGQSLEKKDEQQPEEIKEVKPVEEKSKSIFDGGKTLSKKDLIGRAGHKDAYGNVYNTGEYASSKDQIKEIIEEALGYKKNSYETFSKDEIRRIATALKNKPDRASQLAGKSLEEVLNQ